MLLHDFFNFLLVLSSIMVYFSINPVHSVLFLILAFINTFFILLLFKVEFISILFIVIYVGAIAILFLFIVMMLSIKKSIFDIRINKELFLIILSIFIFGKFFFEFIFSKIFFYSNTNLLSLIQIDYFNDIIFFSQSLYNYYLVLVLLVGLILLVAMIGSIVLTLDFKNKFVIENEADQLSRTSNTVILFIKKKN